MSSTIRAKNTISEPGGRNNSGKHPTTPGSAPADRYDSGWRHFVWLLRL